MTKTVNIRTYIALLTGLILLIALLLPVVVGAQQENKERGRKADVAERVEGRKEKAEERVQEKRLTMETKTEERRQAACERRVEKLEKSMERITTQATRLLGVMDSFHEKVEGFYDKGQLTVSNYDELSANVDSARDAATTEIEALEELNEEIDCTDPEVVVNVSAFKGSANAAKEALREYRKSLVELISSMRSAAAEDKADASEASDDSTDTDETKTDETEVDPESEATNTEGVN